MIDDEALCMFTLQTLSSKDNSWQFTENFSFEWYHQGHTVFLFDSHNSLSSNDEFSSIAQVLKQFMDDFCTPSPCLFISICFYIYIFSYFRLFPIVLYD